MRNVGPAVAEGVGEEEKEEKEDTDMMVMLPLVSRGREDSWSQQNPL